jgi:hypothetical protein
MVSHSRQHRLPWSLATKRQYHISHIAKTIAVLSAVEWSTEVEAHYLSNLRLLRESAVRFARWIVYAKSSKYELDAPFYDLCGALNQDIQSPAFTVPDSAVYIAKKTIPWMLRWYSLLDSGFDVHPEPDPFAPLLLCFGRGGRPHQHHGFLHIEHSISFNYGYGEDAWPAGFARRVPQDITSEMLETWDEEYSHRIGERGG